MASKMDISNTAQGIGGFLDGRTMHWVSHASLPGQAYTNNENDIRRKVNITHQ